MSTKARKRVNRAMRKGLPLKLSRIRRYASDPASELMERLFDEREWRDQQDYQFQRERWLKLTPAQREAEIRDALRLSNS